MATIPASIVGTKPAWFRASWYPGEVLAYGPFVVETNAQPGLHVSVGWLLTRVGDTLTWRDDAREHYLELVTSEWRVTGDRVQLDVRGVGSVVIRPLADIDRALVNARPGESAIAAARDTLLWDVA